MESRDRTLRENAFHALYSHLYRQYRNTIAAMYEANAKQADCDGKAEGHQDDKAMQQALDASAIPVSVYENLIEDDPPQKLPADAPLCGAASEIAARSRDALHMYDDVCADGGHVRSRTYSFEEAKEIVLRGAGAAWCRTIMALLQEGV